ncbi:MULTISPECIES: hypothetical protein [Bacillus]|uniref:hypothetical protein n=1 Tax=Bacillus TaxID=1386 RepID=UPI00097708B2|nr:MULTISPECIES: hypothetical protein [Bacillus]NOL32665.1 hypothetical protein [Bacillus altitudinis]OMP28866.1 hypothetical protein BAE31_01730 [Bacillus sp. I-2]PRS29853.1 hypothetical protein C6X99_01545 [Bacillus pumilus]
MGKFRSMAISSMAEDLGFTTELKNNGTYYNPELNALLITNGFVADLVKLNYFESAIIKMPYRMNKGVCKKILYRESTTNLRKDIGVMIRSMNSFTSDGYHRMNIIKWNEEGDSLIVASEYCPEATIHIDLIESSKLKYIRELEVGKTTLLCKLDCDEERRVVVLHAK